MVDPASLHYKEALKGADLADEVASDQEGRGRLLNLLAEAQRRFWLSVRNQPAAVVAAVLLKIGVSEVEIREGKLEDDVDDG
jgi:hypothetical protein